MPQLQKFKSGDTLILSGVYRNNGTPSSLTGYTIRSQIRKNGTLICEVNVEIADQTVEVNIGKFTMRVESGTTASWAPGTYSCDIEFTVDSVVRSTETFDIPVIKGITEPIVEGV